MSDNQKPSHRAYSVQKREGKEDFWNDIGIVFAHKDGLGFNIILNDDIAVSKKLVLRVFKEKEKQADEKPAGKPQYQKR